MFRLRSLRTKTIAFTILIVLVPLIILGAAGTLYFSDVIKQDIHNDFIKDARMVAQLTSNYLDRALFFIEGQADVTPLINAVDQQDSAALDSQLARITDATDTYYWTYVTDSTGKIIASHPYGSMVGVNISSYPVFTEPMHNGTTYTSSPIPVDISNKPSVIMATPIRKNGSIIGILCGALDNYHYMDLLRSAMATTPRETSYIVNRSGNIFVHDDRGFMQHVDNFSDRPAVQSVLRGEEGIKEFIDPARGDLWLGAFAPVQKYGLGVIIAEPLDLAYKPVRNATIAFLLTLVALTLLLIGASLLVGNYLTRPIVRMSHAAEKVSKTGDIADLTRYLPYDRDDELGGLARAFRDMAEQITVARKKILGEKTHADMYIDVMGHDINNLNQAILSHLEIINHYDQLSPQQKECLDGAITATKDSAAIIRNVRAIQAVATEKPALEKVDLDEVIRQCINEVQRPEDKKVTISYTPRTGLIVKAVPSIKLAFANVIRNSIRYSGPEVHLDIVVREETGDGKKYYVTSVTDDGNGIPPETRETLFTRFRQDSAVPPGKGLGLYATKVLAEQSGGSVSLESRVPEDYKKGTRVIISLPAAEAPGE